MEEDFALVYEFQMSLEEFKEYSNNFKIEQLDFNLDETINISFPINVLLNDNNLYNFNKYEVSAPKSVIGSTVSDKSPNVSIVIKVYVKKQYEGIALEIINNQFGVEEPDELKEYEPIEDEDI